MHAGSINRHNLHPSSFHEHGSPNPYTFLSPTTPYQVLRLIGGPHLKHMRGQGRGHPPPCLCGGACLMRQAAAWPTAWQNSQKAQEKPQLPAATSTFQ